MRLSGTYTLDAPRSAVWPRIFDPTSLISLIPGCQRLDQVSPDEYRGQLLVWLSAVNGAYETYVKVEEQHEPDACRFRGEVTGPTGAISGTAAFSLEALDDTTLLAYQAEGLVTGALGKLNARFLEGVANTLIHQGLGKLNAELITQQASLSSIDADMDSDPAPVYHYIYYPFG